MSLQFKRCTILHLDTLAQVARDTFVAAFEKDNDPTDFKDYVQRAFHPERIKEELQNENSLFYFVYESEELIGYFKLNVNDAQTDVHDLDSLEIERIYVLETYQGKNFGYGMLQKIAGLAQKMEKQYVWLGVWEHNKRAIRFYQRHGFHKFGEHPYYIGTDKQTDWLLRLDV
ncbi:GNAT family N-acetyltransferase [Muricauda sp. JGD-17]|uniref:GNAT family N-acetyltransferase n=1 Tax=Flagellimonas ochracea TaxID=2696472 RepID=A0A964TB23_9FLAO|nr:GNAT family N-acetyltransferase [Allomuricauda ochracea]NAY91577.1 GNAT family N-acetyltransferase [Allomuricauda ochracea]